MRMQYAIKRQPKMQYVLIYVLKICHFSSYKHFQSMEIGEKIIISKKPLFIYVYYNNTGTQKFIYKNVTYKEK